MKKDNDLFKTAILVISGILVGIILILAVQSMSGPKASDKIAATEPALPEGSVAPDGTAPGTAPSTNMPESPYPVSAGLAQLNAQTLQPTYVQVPEGTVVQQLPVQMAGPQVIQGQPQMIVQGGPGLTASPELIQSGPYQQVGGQFHSLPALPVGRNGLLANPCVDPGSTRGLAYRAKY